MDLASIVTNASIFLNPTDNCFTVYEHKWSYGGTEVETVGSVQGCKEACLEDAKCAGFDLGTTTPFDCWTHTAATITRICPNSQWYDQYVRKECSSMRGKCLLPSK